MEKRRCQYEGCKGWAKQGSYWCVAHPDGTPRKVGGAPRGNQNARTHGAYVLIVALEEALKLPAGDLRLEIAVMRAIFQELVRSDLPLSELIAGADTVTGALGWDGAVVEELRLQALVEHRVLRFQPHPDGRLTA